MWGHTCNGTAEKCRGSKRARPLNGSLLLWLLLFCALSPVSSYASVSVSPEIISISPSDESLEINAPYNDDTNNDCSLRVSWALSGTDWGDAIVQSVVIDNQTGEFNYTIENLQNYVDYQVRVEFVDLDGSNNALDVQEVPAIKPYNHLIHSSITTGSLKWSAQGGWGLPDSKYGEFACETCHGRKSGNIKRIKKAIHVTDAASLDQFPIEQSGGEVTFLNAQAGSSDYGDDLNDPPESSTKICEGCHSQNKFHNYNSLANTGGASHYNKDICTSCHVHRNGFKVSCGGCHPEIPEQGSHDEHYNSQILGEELTCSTCHATSVHRNVLSEVSFNGSIDVVVGGTYSDQGGDETSCFDEIDGYCEASAYGSCDNLYCHSNAAPFDKANVYDQPTWGDSSLNCSSCHDSGGLLSSLSGQHAAHTDAATYEFDCFKCHQGTVSDRNTVSTPEQHIDFEKDVSFSSGGSYNAVKTCDNTYCHRDGRGGLPNLAATWSSSDSMLCVGCHNGRIGDSSQMSSFAHLRLANDHWIRQYPCEYCHYMTVDVAGAIKDYSMHVNEQKDVYFDPKWNIPGEINANYNSTTKTCDYLYCHSDGTTVNPTVQDFPWNLGQHAECDSCHGHRGNCTECHASDYDGWTEADQWKKSTPMYTNTGPGTDRANSHVRHLQTNFSCGNCHYNTVAENCEECHDTLTNEEGLVMTEVGHIKPEYHVNKQKDVVFKDGGSYDPVTKACSNTSCHSGDDPVWGDSRNGAVLCLTCHGTTEADIDDYGAFNGTQAKINMTEWMTSGHGRMTSDGNYTSGNPPADFPGNPCWYCHDNEVLHDNVTNPYRLKEHPQFEKRFVKECVYCHMEQQDEECWGCHDESESLSADHQLTNLTGIDPDDGLPYTQDHAPYAGMNVSCLTSDCHLPQTDDQCRNCHDNASTGSGALQLDDDVVRVGTAGKSYVISEIRVGMTESPYAVDHIEFSSTGSKSTVSCMASETEWGPSGCHTADVHIHNTGAGTWTFNQKEDVRNQYVMMGVCLQCHDNDENDRCNTCHVWAGAEEDNPYRLGYDPGTGFHTGSSKASSTHFGFMHFEDYEASLADIEAVGTLSVLSDADQKYEVTRIVDDTQNWGDDALVGKTLQLTSGPFAGEIRPILVNYNTTVTVKGYFPEALSAGTTYKILGSVWKGGKFCWDCHDPHGDSNIYMIQDDIAVTTDGLFGKPLERASVSFTRTISGLDYAKNDPPYDGLCNVCHTNVDHYHADYGDAHRSGRRCTDCHNHGFGEGHGSGQGCNECHDQKPVPNHLGFGQPRDCTKCHDGVINQRTDIIRQFNGQSHHVQGIEVDNIHCYQCHWEATEDGLINNDYHAGYNYKTHKTVIGAKNDMAIWDPGGRPDRYELGVTTITFNTATIGTADERENVTNVTQHCLGCHSTQHNDTDVFGDCKTPRQYAWDRTSIAERYLNEGTTNWGRYIDFDNAAKKVQAKAYSAHGRAILNEGGWSAATGEDGTLPNTRSGTENVQCYDCHNSHGSYTTGITSSYPTFDNTYRGGNLKETQAGKGGYGVTYRASSTIDDVSIVNPINPGAAQCFDCHETPDAGTMPWGYSSTFGATQPIMGYRDSSRFDDGPRGVTSRFAFKEDMVNIGGHLKASKTLTNNPERAINGLCTPCHDPHGVSPSLGDDRVYAVPLLKGTWLTSPYKEDIPQRNVDNNSSSYVNIDRKTFGTSGITESEEQFAGLCLRCHPKTSLTDGIDKNTAFKSVDRIHETVKGWGNNAEHSFPCAKCHSAHVSGLGSLMRTNCLDANHRGEVVSGGVPGRRNTSQTFPRLNNIWPSCHESASAAGGAWDEQQWNMVTPW